MELKSALEQLGLLQKKLYAYQTASSSLYLDSVTVARRILRRAEVWPLVFWAGESQKLDDSTGNRRITGVFGGSEGESVFCGAETGGRIEEKL